MKISFENLITFNPTVTNFDKVTYKNFIHTKFSDEFAFNHRLDSNRVYVLNGEYYDFITDDMNCGFVYTMNGNRFWFIVVD